MKVEKMPARLQQNLPAMPTSPSAPAASALPDHRRRFAIRGLRSAAAGVVIAVLITGMNGSGFHVNLVQSLCISVSCWFFIDSARLPLALWAHRHAPPDTTDAARRWPGWPLMLVAVVIGTLLGFSVGNAIGSLILGRPLGMGFFRGSLEKTLALLLGSLIPGTVITYWFYARETIAAKTAAMETAQRQVAETRLKLLESQLEPHMLFNTLANLRVLIGLDPVQAQAMLDQLIAFLRATLSASRVSQHPLQAEFARLEDYLALMRVRMGARLQTSFDLPEALAQVPVPPLLLQPLVENAIKHGLEPAVDGGRIAVSAERDGPTLVLRVHDTGVGLGAVPSDGTNFGLSQVRERLATLYGPEASLALSMAPDGTVATIRLPLSAVATP